MRVRVRIMAPLYFGLDSVDQISLDLNLEDGSTIEDVMNILNTIHPGFKDKVIKNGKVLEMHDILVNGRSIDFLDGLRTRLKDGDSILVVSPFGG
ncbi:MAG: MoaD/ThiS family protein [Thermoproteus sp.]|jgi:molybdopterin synthase sulfur carrier subunit|nr:MoaD/ThiS family protein [Thermoproteus sp.]MDT7881596.1 MoaD/ThiS family protein [Thermoproteus sp.]